MLSLLIVSLAAADPGDPPALDARVRVPFRIVEGYGVATPEVGARLVVAGQNSRLRSGASTDLPVLAELPLGTPVFVRALPEDTTTTEERPYYWVPVRVPWKGAELFGHMASTTLTGAAWTVDLDQDGEDEFVTVGWNFKTEVVVRVREPAVPGDAGVQFLNLGHVSDINGPQNIMGVSLHGDDKTGLPLVEVNWEGRDMCGSGDYFRYASYRSPGAGKAGVLAHALEHGGSGGDAPVWWSTEVAFDPAAGTATVTKRWGEDASEYGGEDTEETTVIVHRLKDGVFVSAPPAP